MQSSATDREPGLATLKQPLEAILCLLLIAMVGVTFAQVVFRYLLQTSLSWSEEVARFLLIWLASLGAAYGFKTGSHFALRFAVQRLDLSHQRKVATLVMFLVTTFLGVFCWQALRFTIEVRGMTAPATGLSMSVPYSAAFFGGLLMLYYFLRNAIEERRTLGQTPESAVSPED